MRRLTLLRRLSVRGNSLGVLVAATSDDAPLPAAPKTLEANTSRLVESFPQVGRQLLQVLPAASREFRALGAALAEPPPPPPKSRNSLEPPSQRQTDAELDATIDDDELPDEDTAPPQPSRRRNGPGESLGDYFAHLQELDLGQCELHYIDWTLFRKLDSLKRLLLDGNKLR